MCLGKQALPRPRPADTRLTWKHFDKSYNRFPQKYICLIQKFVIWLIHNFNVRLNCNVKFQCNIVWFWSSGNSDRLEIQQQCQVVGDAITFDINAHPEIFKQIIEFGLTFEIVARCFHCRRMRQLEKSVKVVLLTNAFVTCSNVFCYLTKYIFLIWTNILKYICKI